MLKRFFVCLLVFSLTFSGIVPMVINTAKATDNVQSLRRTSAKASSREATVASVEASNVCWITEASAHFWYPNAPIAPTRLRAWEFL